MSQLSWTKAVWSTDTTNERAKLQLSTLEAALKMWYEQAITTFEAFNKVCFASDLDTNPGQENFIYHQFHFKLGLKHLFVAVKTWFPWCSLVLELDSLAHVRGNVVGMVSTKGVWSNFHAQSFHLSTTLMEILDPPLIPLLTTVSTGTEVTSYQAAGSRLWTTQATLALITLVLWPPHWTQTACACKLRRHTYKLPSFSPFTSLLPRG